MFIFKNFFKNNIKKLFLGTIFSSYFYFNQKKFIINNIEDLDYSNLNSNDFIKKFYDDKNNNFLWIIYNDNDDTEIIFEKLRKIKINDFKILMINKDDIERIKLYYDSLKKEINVDLDKIFQNKILFKTKDKLYNNIIIIEKEIKNFDYEKTNKIISRLINPINIAKTKQDLYKFMGIPNKNLLIIYYKKLDHRINKLLNRLSLNLQIENILNNNEIILVDLENKEFNYLKEGIYIYKNNYENLMKLNKLDFNFEEVFINNCEYFNYNLLKLNKDKLNLLLSNFLSNNLSFNFPNQFNKKNITIYNNIIEDNKINYLKRLSPNQTINFSNKINTNYINYLDLSLINSNFNITNIIKEKMFIKIDTYNLNDYINLIKYNNIIVKTEKNKNYDEIFKIINNSLDYYYLIEIKDLDLNLFKNLNKNKCIIFN